jgi:putative RecB family exonuclease
MDIEELRKQPHLSFSAINEYLMCGLKYWFSRIEKISPEFIPDNLIFGKCVHQVLEEYNNCRLIGEIPPLPTLISIFETCWDKAVEQGTIQYSKGKGYKSLRREGAALIKHFYENRHPDEYSILAIEEPFSLEIDGLSYPIIGIIDLIEEDDAGTVIITDYKTSSRSFSQSEVDSNLQLTLYQLAMEQNGYSSRDMLLKLDCLIKTQTPKHEQYYTVRAKEDIQRLLKIIQLVLKGISNEVFLPTSTSWMCTNCPYKSYCDQWLMENSYETQ